MTTLPNRDTWSIVYVKSSRVNTHTDWVISPFTTSLKMISDAPTPPLTYLGTQLGEERSTSQVAYRFMWTGRLDVMLTGLEGCMCGDGTPPVRGSPPRSDMLEAGNGRSDGASRRSARSSSASLRMCVVLFCVCVCCCWCYRSSFLCLISNAPAGANA